MNDQPVAETLPDNSQYSNVTDIHASGGILTRNPSKRTAANLRLREHGHQNRFVLSL